MKILITTDLFVPAINGVVTSILNLEKELTEQGHEVRILTMSADARSKKEGNVYFVKSMPSYIYPEVRVPFSRAADMIEELIQWTPDVIHSQCEFFSYSFARRIAKATGAALVHTYHTLYEQYTEYVPLGKRLSRTALSKWMKGRLKEADTIIVPTKKVGNTLQAYGLTNHMERIPTGIDLAKFQNPKCEEAVRDLKAQYDIADDDFVLLSLGRLGYEKRIDELLYGLREILKIKERVKLLLVGDGPARGGLEELAAELGVEEHVIFAGMVKPSEVPAYYRLGDVFVCASTSETQGLTYIEAAASGLPLVCRKDPCLYGVLEESGNGYSYTDIYRFAKYIRRVMEDKSFQIAAGNHSRKIAENFGTTTFGNRVEQVYKNVARRKECPADESFIVCEKSTYRA